MGCTDSTAIQNHMRVNNQKVFPRNPHQFPYKEIYQVSRINSQSPASDLKHYSEDSHLVKRTSQLNNEGLFENSQEYLLELYQFCEGNLQKFFSQLQEKISDIYMSISKDTLQQMNQNILINNESKIKISQEILWFNLNILKVASRKNEHKFNPMIFKQINKLQKNLVGYLKMKYPRGGQSFVPGDLMAVFKQFDLSQDIEFDILKNANTYFGSDSDQNLSREIKIFLNKIMTELDLNYPKFQKTMQQQVFVVFGDEGEKKTLNYKIGRKIPQNVPKYTDLQNNTLQINSPQIFRVLIKWMEYLDEILISPNENINKKKNFKCFIEQNQNDQKIFDQINEDEYYDLINFELIEKIQKEKLNYFEQNDALLKDMDRFNSHLIKLLDTSIRRQKFVPLREMETIKYSNLNAKFIAWVLGQKIMLALKKLIKVGRSFYNTKAMLNLDLIQFKVSDMMRSMVSGTKKEILAVYSNLKKLQKQGQIKIIKIKNRLGTSLNDAMIIFAMKDTFLICEIQLILTDGQQKINQKYKNIQLLNHFFYQLQRSPYGILSEIAVLLAYKDSKVAYEDNITFEINKIEVERCQKVHPNSVNSIKQQTRPFICTKCTKFYFKYENIFLMKHCHECNIFICGKCIFAADKELQKTIVNRQLAVQIERAVAKTMTKLRNILSSFGATSILQLFTSPFKRIQELFGPKKVVISKLIDYLNTKVKNNQDDLYFVIVSFRTGKAVFKQLLYKPAWKQIFNPFNGKQTFNEKKKIFYTSYDLILFYQPAILKADNKDQFYGPQQNMLHLFISEEQLAKIYDPKSGLALSTFGIADFKLVVNIEKPPQVQFQSNHFFKETSDKKNKCTKQFKFKSLHEATAGLPDLAGAKSILKFKDLGIQNVHLNFFKEIPWANTIKQLKINKNNISSLSLVLQSCVNIERLYVNQNYIKQLVFTKPLPKIDIINAVNNEIELIEQCQNIKNISKFLLEGNRLEQFPKSDFPNMKILSLKSNPIRNFDTVYTSTLPNIQQLFLHYEEYESITGSRPNTEIDLQTVVLPFQKLKSVQSESNFQEIIIKSKKIQRITLYRNNLQSLRLQSLENLRYLMLSSNNLLRMDFLFPQKDNFQNNSIYQIDLSMNSIDTLPIMKSTSLTKINLNSNQIHQINSLTDSLLPNLQIADFSTNTFQEIPKINLPKVKSLNLSRNFLQKISQLENSSLDKLQKIQLSNCDVIGNFPLLKMKSLNQIRIQWTEVHNMQNLSKSTLPSLKIIYFDYCTINSFPLLNIETVEEITFKNTQIKNLVNLQKSILYNLKTLALNDSQIQSNQNQQADQPNANNTKNIVAKTKQVFSCKFSFPLLQTLSLNGSNFQNTSGLETSVLPKIQELSLQGCHFAKYPKLRMSNLKTLRAGKCQLQSIESMLTPQLSSLEKTYISGNLIQRMNLTMKQVKILDLSLNKLLEFSHVGELNDLLELNLESNKLQRFPLIKAKNLKQLFINNNPLKDINQLQQCKLNSLQELKITNCDLGQFLFPVLNLQSVKSIYMMQNKIKDISNLTLSELPMVEDINLSNNLIETVPVLKLPQLKFFRLNENQISDISNFTLSQCPQLTIIELQTNLITSLPEMPFPNLTKIFMHKNQCTDVKQFNKSSTIKSLSILNICQSTELSEFPVLKCTFQELYANETKLCDVIKVNQYKGLIRLQLNGNGIKSIPILNHKDLEMIQFQDNQLEDIDEFAKGQYLRCTQFSVKGNKITRVPTLKMQKVKRVYFNQNAIQDAKLFCESHLPDLQMVSFDHNKLKKLEKLPFPKLSQVYMSGNKQLSEMTCFNLPEYTQLGMIVADSTGIKKVQVLPKMPQLQKIWVSNSELQDLEWFDKCLQGLPKLYFINFTGNKIKVLPAMKSNNLREVYLTNNPIENIDKVLNEKREFKSYGSWSISFKGKAEEDYAKVNEKVCAEHNYIYLSEYYG